MIPRLPFGRTGHDSSRLLFGAAALGKASRAEADLALGKAFDAGVNHYDTANSYGWAEERMGPWASAHRNEIFLATKTQKRGKAEAMAELENSLRLLKTDHIDLWQMHILVEEEEWRTAMGEGGALEAFVEARAQGKVRFLGVSGHGHRAPSMHLRSLGRFGFDSVLLAWNWPLSRDPAYAADFASLLAECRSRGTAVQLIKAFLRRPWGGRPQDRATWYEPLSGAADIGRALAWAWATEGCFVNSMGDIDLLPLALAAASENPPTPSDEEMEAMAARCGMTDLFA